MKKTIIRMTEKGFSLIELMAVVAIIAILASFAIPQYQSFQAKARQKEGLTMLNSFYVAAKATEAEQGQYPGNLVGTGFNPAGQLHYRISVADSTFTPTSGPNNDSCINTINACGTYGGWAEVTAGSFAAGAPNTCTAAVNATASTFTTCVSASIRSNASADQDTWSVTDTKAITNTNDGIN